MDKRLLLIMKAMMMAGLVLGALGCISIEGRSRTGSQDTFDNDADDAQDEGGTDEDGTGEDGTDEGGQDEDGQDEDGTDEDGTDEDGTDEGGQDEGGQDEGGDPPVADDAAEVVSVDLPTQLACGGTYQASVQMRNTGQTTWSRAAGFKLGAGDGEDPLYGPGSRVWLDESDSVAPGETHTFEFELTAPQVADSYLSDWQMVHEGVQWFGETTSEVVSVTCSVQTWCDPLTDSSLRSGFDDKTIDGGSFSQAGWQSTHHQDQLLLRLSTPLSASGSLEIDVSNFSPTTQYSGTKHQIINMYTSNDGSQGVFTTDEAWWNIRTGTNYGTGFKFLAAPNGGDSREEVRLVESATWDPNDTYTFTVSWDAHNVEVFLDGSLLQSLAFDGRVQPLQHVFVGKDNVYGGQVGPIYSNLCVTSLP